MQRARIFLTGVGGQGTLTATTLLARTALAAGIPVTSGEIHGMMGGPVLADQTAPVQTEGHGQVLQANVVHDLVVGALHGRCRGNTLRYG